MSGQVAFLALMLGLLATALGVEFCVRSPWPGRVTALLLAGFTVWLAFGSAGLSGQQVSTWAIGLGITYAVIHAVKWRRAERDLEDSAARS